MTADGRIMNLHVLWIYMWCEWSENRLCYCESTCGVNGVKADCPILNLNMVWMEWKQTVLLWIYMWCEWSESRLPYFESIYGVNGVKTDCAIMNLCMVWMEWKQTPILNLYRVEWSEADCNIMNLHVVWMEWKQTVVLWIYICWSLILNWLILVPIRETRFILTLTTALSLSLSPYTIGEGIDWKLKVK